MASTVAKFAVYNINNEDFLSTRNISKSMEEDVVLEQLSDDRFQQRSEILDYLRTEVRKHGGRIQFQNMSALFRGLSRALADSNWTVRHHCVQLISEMIAGLDDDLDTYMSTVLPKLVANIGDSKVALRKAVIQTLHLYMKHSSDVQNVFHAIVEHGLESPDPKVRAETTINFPLLLTAEFAKQDLFTITQALAKRLNGSAENEENKIAIISLERIRGLVGNEVFVGYVQRLSKPVKQVYLQLTDRDENGYDGPVDVNLNSSKGVLGSGTWKRSHSRDSDTVGRGLEFGIIPKHIMDQLLDQHDLRVRAQGIEGLREIMNDMADLAPLLPHILAFISFLCNLLDDVNFKVTTVTLDIFDKLVNKLGQGVKPYLKSLMSALTKRLGDNQIVIRQANMKVLMHLMQILTPKPILNQLTDSLQHRNSRVREEALNMVIASLLTFPSYDFDLGQLCQTIAHTLVDPKRKVRQASLEAFAVLAQAMGPGRLQPLVSAVDSVELSMEGDGVMAAVQARLARRQLPRLNKDGLVEYSIPLPASATTRGSPPSADIEWIMAAAGGGTSSARERNHSEPQRELSQPMSARSASGQHENAGPTPAPRRYHSAGKNRKKLPWEELPNEDDGVELEKLENSNQRNHPNSAPSHKRQTEDKPPLKARHTWSDVDDNAEIKVYRHTKASTGSRDQSPDTGSGAGGSYRQIHLNKLKRERERPSFNAYTAGLGSKNDESPTGHGTSSTDRDWPGWKYTNGTSFSDIFGDTDILSSTANKKRGVGRQDSKDRDDKYFPSFGTSKDEEFLRKSLASTWPSQDKDASISRKRVDPLSEPTTPSTAYPPEWPGSEESPKKSSKVNQSSIPLKPALARSATRKTKHVPPLDLNEKGHKPSAGIEHERAKLHLAGLKKDDDFDDLDDSDDDFYQMQNSLQSLRNSAARKRAARRAENSNGSSRTTSRSPSPPFDDSGHYSVLYDSLDPSPKSTPKKKGKKSNESPFSNKPRVARLSNSEKESPENSSREIEPNPFEFSPTGGVTFRDKVKSDVSVVGQGYGKQDAPSNNNVAVPIAQPRSDSPPIPTHQKANARERRRQTKGNMVSPLTMASMNHPGPVDNDDISEEVGVIGKGVFGTSYAPPSQEYGGDKSKRANNRKDSETGRSNLPKGVYGVYGVGMKQSNSFDDNDSSDEEDPASISMSKSTKDKVAKKQQEIELKKAEKQAEKQAEREKRQRERELWQKQQEREREKAREQQREKLKEMKSFAEDIPIDSLTISGSNSANTPPKGKTVIGKPPVATTPKKKLTKSPSSAGEGSPSKVNTSLNHSLSMQYADDEADLKPFPNPDAVLRDALRFLQSDDWEVKMDGLSYIKRLAVVNPDTLNQQLHTVIVAVLAEVKNLRSSVARAAISTIAEMFTQLRVNMDKDLDQLCKVLLQKASESNGFIREDVDKSLGNMVTCVTPQRALIALITGGASHRNVAVRKTCAQFLVEVVEKMGPGRLLSGIKDVTDKILPATAQFCVDPSPETRYYGRKIMYQLMNHEDFERLLIKYVAQKDVRQIKEIMERLRQDGLGEMPSETPSARTRRSNTNSGSGSRSNSGTREKAKSAGSDVNGLTPPGSTRKVRKSPRMDEASMEVVKDLCATLAASDFRDRLKAIQYLQDLTVERTDLIISNIVKIFDAFTPRLSDSNSKVNLTALQTMLQLVPRLREYLGAVINTIVPVLGTNLASKNTQIHQTTLEVLDSLMEHVENSLLLQPFANLAQFGNARVKPDMIEKLAYLSSKVYQRKHQTVTRYVLPVMWHLLSNTTGSGAVPGGTGNIRTATANLANSLFNLMGQSLIDQAQSNLSQRNLKTFQEMLENPQFA